MAIELTKAIKSMDKALRSFTTVRQMTVYAKEYAKLVGKRTRLGFGVDRNNTPNKRLKPLSNSYKDQRKGKIAFFTLKGKQGSMVVPFKPKNKPKLSGFTTPSKSNLTRTGELLSSLKGRGKSGGRATIEPSGKRNKDITGWQEEQGRSYLKLSRSEINKLSRQIGNDLEKYINKALS